MPRFECIQTFLDDIAVECKVVKFNGLRYYMTYRTELGAYILHVQGQNKLKIEEYEHFSRSNFFKKGKKGNAILARDVLVKKP